MLLTTITNWKITVFLSCIKLKQFSKSLINIGLKRIFKEVMHRLIHRDCEQINFFNYDNNLANSLEYFYMVIKVVRYYFLW